MSDRLFIATLALALLAGGTLAIASAWAESMPGPCAARAPATAPQACR